jgi:imidazolonepropionase-like amidohydrolase
MLMSLTSPERPAVTSKVIAAERVFDGRRMLDRHVVTISGDRIAAVEPVDALDGTEGIRFVDGTLLPGFIDLHAHHVVGRVPPDVLLRHGITTVREVGGPLAPPSGGDGRLRVLRAGPILTAPGGYPVPVFGAAVAWEIRDADGGRAAVSRLAAGHATVVKIALEPGGAPGAPWNAYQHGAPAAWPMLANDVVEAIVSEAHAHGLTVTCHVSGPAGADIALSAGVDEWAHVPCERLPDDLIAGAAASGVAVVGTLDTLRRCAGVMDNAQRLVAAGVHLLYGTDLAHPDVPWGINAHELILMLDAGQGELTPLDVLASATSRAGAHLGRAPLGQLAEGAPADLIGVRGDPTEQLKTLEYPDLVIAGGVILLDDGPRHPNGARVRRLH